MVTDPTEPTEPAEPAEPGIRQRYSFSQRVLHAFVEDGRLTTIPARQRKRQVILRYLATTDFEDGRAYPEREVDQRLALRHRDVAALRRYLVDSRYLTREAGIYRRRPMADWPIDPDEGSPDQPLADRSPEE
ncbi:MAG: DUF2087 domain-containing protein [Chloroflexi bacterium]|nr:DUF2087 domain-containing protein [Chloroflexota bacterium]